MTARIGLHRSPVWGLALGSYYIVVSLIWPVSKAACLLAVLHAQAKRGGSGAPKAPQEEAQAKARCFPDASQMLPRCFPDASRCLPDAPQMLPDASRCSQMLPRCPQMLPDPPRCFPDAFQMPPFCISRKTSVWGLTLES